MLKTALHFSHTLLQEIVQLNDVVVDATMGNGNDTEFLAKLVGQQGKVLAFDIQEQAISHTRKRLESEDCLAQVQLIHQGHEHVAQYLTTSIKAAVFNLGYLPKSNKSIITLPPTTKTALNALLDHLLPKGRIIVVSYYGHTGGIEELKMLQEYCSSLPQAKYNVLTYQFINQKNQPPVLFCIEKK